MILDYNYDKNKKSLYLSYINDDGKKKVLDFNVNKFKTYSYKMDGEYDTWDGHKASLSYTYNPSNFDIKRFILDLPEKYKRLISKRVFPKVYTFDIETEISDKFPDPALAEQKITTISICSPECNTIVLGTRVVSEDDKKWMSKSFDEYVRTTQFFNTLGLEKPTFKYITFTSEKEMLEYFLKNIVAKVPILTGWNSILFDWQYIVNRIRDQYPQLSIKLSSCIGSCNVKSYSNWKNERIKLPMPCHTLILDMIDVIGEDRVVLPIKESMTLDYIAYESLGVNKIKYDGTLQDLYENDYNKYVFYNAIDSFLVQLINYRFKTLNVFYLYSLYCTEKIGSCFSKVLLTEALTFNYFYKNNLKIVWEEHHPVKSKLLGAYVRVPTPGIHNFVCCNDFASLYPSTIITCNISFENLIGVCYDEEKLKPYRDNPDKYTVICSSVYTNDDEKKLIGTFIDEEKLKPYRNNPDYFVSVYGHVYKNDKDYAFRSIQKELKVERNKSKYLAKKLDAQCVRDIELVLKNRKVGDEQYEDSIIKALKNNNIYNINSPQDWKNASKEELESYKKELNSYIEYLTIDEQSKKLMGNSMYGGTSKESFFWYNMELANDITGESKNLIHMMENHLPNYMKNEWPKMNELHDKLGIKLNNDFCNKILNNGDDSFINIIYGDSCEGNTLISTVEGNIPIEKLFDDASIVYYDRGKEFAISDVIIKNFNGNEIINSNIKYIIRHKTNKSKWEITDSNNNTIRVTGDHSMIIWKGGEMTTCKPNEISVGEELITMNGVSKVTKVLNIGNFDNDYVYDIEVFTDNANEHNFFGNNILIHNTDSVIGSSIIKTDKGDKTIEELFNENYKNNLFHTHKGHELVSCTNKVLNWDNGLYYAPIKYIMRHKVNKPKWKLKTSSGKEVIVTNDHSMIVFRDGVKMEVKPYEIQPTDKILVVH